MSSSGKIIQVTSADIVDGTIVNADISASAALDPLKFASNAYVAVSDSNDQAVASATVVTVTFATEIEDLLGMHSGSSGQLVIPTGYAGLWTVTFAGAWQSGGTGIRQFQPRKNGVALVGQTVPPASSATTGYVSVTSQPFRAVAGDILTVVAYQDSGGSLNILGATLASLFFATRFG